MWSYFIKRILLFIPIFFVVTIVAFVLNKVASGDPLAEILSPVDEQSQAITKESYRQMSLELLQQRGIDKPLFYFTIGNRSIPKPYHYTYYPADKNQLLAFSPTTSGDDSDSHFKPKAYHKYIPQIYWNGSDNQYNDWLTGLLGLKKTRLTRSLVDGMPVSQKIKEAAFWTFWMNGVGLFFSFGLAILYGVFIARRGSSTAKQKHTGFLYLLYSIPSFWLATILVVFFTTSEYGMKIFSSIGLPYFPEGVDTWTRFIENFKHLTLPIICISLSTISLITIQVKRSMEKTLDLPFITALRAKGLPESKIIRKHAFPNSLFPIITMIGEIVPALLSGALAIEVIFNIPGMGGLMYDSIFNKDWPIVYGILVTMSFLTMLGTLLADLLYARLDPRIRYS